VALARTLEPLQREHPAQDRWPALSPMPDPSIENEDRVRRDARAIGCLAQLLNFSRNNYATIMVKSGMVQNSLFWVTKQAKLAI